MLPWKDLSQACLGVGDRGSRKRGKYVGSLGSRPTPPSPGESAPESVSRLGGWDAQLGRARGRRWERRGQPKRRTPPEGRLRAGGLP